MPGPIAGLRYIHCALSRETAALEAAALALDGTDMASFRQRVTFLDGVMHMHTSGEEVGLFPALDERVAGTAPPYLLDHATDREMFAELGDLAGRLADGSAERTPTLARLRRQTAALHDHLVLHVRKEEEIIVPLVESRFTPAEQGAMVARIVGTIPPPQMQAVLPWIVGRLDADDRDIYVRELMQMMPPERAPVAAGWLRAGLDTGVWSDLRKRIPTLPA